VAVALALTCALGWGLSDFLGGLWSRRHGAWVIAVAVQGGSFIATLMAWLITGASTLATHDVLWAVVAGVGMGAGTGLLFRGLARGTMGVVAPLSALLAALMPLVLGLARGERPGASAVIGIAVALPAIWLVAAESEAATASARGASDGLLSGVGFGMAFIGIDQLTDHAGIGPLVVMQAISILPVLLLAWAASERAVPRNRRAWSAACIGVLGATANVTFLLAVERGPLTVTSVLASLYPAVTVILAVLVLRERIRRSQAAGLGLAALAVVLISLA
jgi:drug/metabolite transporter (DMT)-like permease